MTLRTYLMILLSLVVWQTGCTDKEMDDLNRDTSNPPVDAVAAQFQLTDAITSICMSTIAGEYAWHVASYTEQIFGTGGKQLMYAELRDPAVTAAPTTFNNAWNNTYHNMLNLTQIISKCSSGGLNDGQDDIQGIAVVLRVVGFELLTELHGDIPYREALDVRNLTPGLDSQESIYDDLLKEIDKGIALLQTASEKRMNNAGNHDILFGGDAAQWLATAYAVKARLLLAALAVRPENLAAIIEAGEKSLQLGFKGAALRIFNGNGADNSWAAYFSSRHYSGACGTVARLMEMRDDPRLALYATDIFGSGVCYAAAGDAMLAESSDKVGAPGWLTNKRSSIDIISLSSLRFILAEAKARSGVDATVDFRAGIAASFAEWDESDPTSLFAREGWESYADNLGPLTLQEIMVQKYIAESRDQQLYTYSDLRRCRRMGEAFVAMRNPNNTDNGKNRWPLRLPYGNSDVVSNPKVAAAFGEGNSAGMYVFEKGGWLY